jgi:hypothetical protein
VSYFANMRQRAMAKAKTGAQYGDQQYLQRLRQQGVAGADSAMNQPGNFFLGADPRSIQEQASQFMNPYQSQVIDGVRGEFDFMRGQAMNSANANATQAGAFGGSRHGVMAGARLGELDRAQGQQIGQMLHSGWQDSMQQGLQYSEYQRSLAERQAQEPMFRQQMAMNNLNAGMGPWQPPKERPNRMGSAIGGATAGSAFGPWGAAIGGGLGFLGSYL